jgi:hypothetical protein
MSVNAESYRRVRGQVTFLLSVVELLARTIDPGSAAARTALRAVELARAAIATAESAAEVYASIAVALEEVLVRVEQLKATGGAPSHVEWEWLRSQMEDASAEIAAAVEVGPSADPA